MDKQSIIAQLESDINALQRQVADFNDHPENVTALEWELFVRRLDLMHDYCRQLKLDTYINRTASVLEERPSSSVREEPREEIKTDVEPVIIKEETIASRQAEARSYQDATNTVEMKSSSQKFKKQTASVGGLFGDTLSIADKFKDETSVADNIARTKSDKSLADNLQRKPIKDLKDAIGINEKFILINELFDGNRQSYEDAVSKLNSSANLEAAQEYIAALAMQYNWTINDHVKNLSDLVARKFMS